MPIDYEKKSIKAYKDNVRDTPRAAKEGELDTKIKNFCKLHGFKYDDIVKAIQNNKIVCACFAKKPNTQNFYEKTAAEYIKKIAGVRDFKNLGNKALFVSRGGTLSKEEMRGGGGSSPAKSIDFKWRYGGLEFFANHKYTKGTGGGSQGNQYNDMVSFIQECNPTTKRDGHFVAIADGEYYEKKDQEGKTRLEKLQSKITGSGHVHACSIEELENLMKKLAGK